MISTPVADCGFAGRTRHPLRRDMMIALTASSGTLNASRRSSISETVAMENRTVHRESERLSRAFGQNQSLACTPCNGDHFALFDMRNK